MRFNKSYRHIVSTLPEKVRCSDYLIGIFPGLETKNAVKKVLKKGWVTVDGNIAGTGRWIIGGEKIVFAIKDIPIPVWEKQLTIHYEDEYLAVVEKSAGIPTSGNQFHNLRNALPFNLQPSVIDDALIQPEPVHRLDAATSGLVIVAKTWNARRLLEKKLKYKGIQKEYLAFVQGEINAHTIIHIPIEVKSATTLIKRQSTFLSPTYGKISLISAFPLTGRTHQIRIHLASFDCPILGDKIHNQQNSKMVRGLMLHAHRLEFYHPIIKEKISVTSPMPRRIRKRMV